jgi:formyl-CoA transferase
MEQTISKGPLHGVTVLDLTRVVAGPFCTGWLADMGATVIKIENPGDGGDHTRASEPVINGFSAWYAALNRSKKTVTLNLKDPEGKALFLELVKKADVVTENFRPGVMDRLALGYEALKAVNPKIIFASVSGYGSYGPYSQRPGYDVISQGMGGIMSLTGFEDGPPTKVGTTLGDITAGMNLAIGILAALQNVHTTGQGQKLEVALVDSVFALCPFEFLHYGLTGQVPPRRGNHYNLWCPYGTFKAADGYYQLGVGTEKHFQLLCAMMGKPELPQDPRFNSHNTRMANKEELYPIIDSWAAQYTVKQVVEKLNNVGVPCSGVYDLADIAADPHFAQREMIKTLPQPQTGDLSYVNMPVRFFGTPLVQPQAAGALGEYNEDVYTQLLGLDEDKLNQLKEKGVI